MRSGVQRPMETPAIKWHDKFMHNNARGQDTCLEGAGDCGPCNHRVMQAAVEQPSKTSKETTEGTAEQLVDRVDFSAWGEDKITRCAQVRPINLR